MRSILLLFILAFTFNVYANPLGKRKCKTKSKEVSCKIYKGKKEPSKAVKVFSGSIPIGIITLSAILATNPKKAVQ